MRHHVTEADTAAAMGSGDVEVLGTPRLIAWLEAATVAAAAPYLADAQTSVGTAVRVRHRHPTPVGGTVQTHAELDGTGALPRLAFRVSAVDGSGTLVADGEIDRVVVDREGFGG